MHKNAVAQTVDYKGNKILTDKKHICYLYRIKMIHRLHMLTERYLGPATSPARKWEQLVTFQCNMH